MIGTPCEADIQYIQSEKAHDPSPDPNPDPNPDPDPDPDRNPKRNPNPHLAKVSIEDIFSNPAYMGIFRKFMTRTADEVRG